MKRDGVRLAFAALIVLLIGAGLPILLFGPFRLGVGGSGRLQASLTYVGVMVTAAVTLVGLAAKWQTDKRLMYEKEEQLKQLRLDAAMRAGQLFSPTDGGHAQPAAMASGLLALTSLDHADLAVALLVDLWSDSNRSAGDDKAAAEDGTIPAEDGRISAEDGKVSTETAILVIDAALRSASPNAQLVAAELLCRNSKRLQPGQSLHWPSSLDGSWNPYFSHRTKLLIVEALVRMTLACHPTETALRSAAVRLYGIWFYDRDPQIKGCIGKLINALIPRLKRLHYEDFIQGSQLVMISQLQKAAESKHTNPDRYLDRLSTKFAHDLRKWATNASGVYTGLGCLAAGQNGPITTTADHANAIPGAGVSRSRLGPRKPEPALDPKTRTTPITLVSASDQAADLTAPSNDS
jgi:hypothetical protein